jgi:RimJ/RimL family protein N-acetyltransferase
MSGAPFDPRPVVLTGTHVILEPLAIAHARDLHVAGVDEATWAFMPRPALRSVEDAESMVRQALVESEAGHELPFAIVEARTGRTVGSTRWLDIQRPHRALEIGWTWIGPSWRRTAINTECKFLLLEHVFETLGSLPGDAENRCTQRAIAASHRENRRGP